MSDARKPLVLSMSLWTFWLFLLPIAVLCGLGLYLCGAPLLDALTLTAFVLGFGFIFSIPIGVLMYFSERVSISDDGVHIEQRRKKQQRLLPWTDYMFLYTYPWHRGTWLLFTPVMLDKEAQLAVLHKNLCDTTIRLPYAQDGGCLILSLGQATATMRSILNRLPPHIRVMSRDQCAKL